MSKPLVPKEEYERWKRDKKAWLEGIMPNCSSLYVKRLAWRGTHVSIPMCKRTGNPCLFGFCPKMWPEPKEVRWSIEEGVEK